MRQELCKLGVKLDVDENTVRVYNGAHLPNEALFGHNDHRIVMALTLALTQLGGEIEGCEAVSKSYPNFFEEIGRLGIAVKLIN